MSIPPQPPAQNVAMVLQGGLGNQLFQYAAGLAAAKHLGGTLWLTPPEQNKHSSTDYRPLFSRARRLGAGEHPDASAAPFVFDEPADAFGPWHPERYRGHPNLLLKGYWQYLPTIRPLLTVLRLDILAELGERRMAAQAALGIQDPRTTAFVHVRRGDYLELPPTDFWRQEGDYYSSCLAALRGGAQPPTRTLLFSDDPIWCKAQPWADGLEIIVQPDELLTLAAMSLCQGGAIIANSTFSWWGAMLGAAAAGAPVYYPARWYKDVEPSLFPDSWKKIG